MNKGRRSFNLEKAVVRTRRAQAPHAHSTAFSRFNAGFTLLEILLVIVILAVSTAMIAPSFFSATAPSVEAEARRLALALNLASDEAALAGIPMRWSARAHSYLFESPNGEQEWRPNSEQSYREYQLPAGIVIADVQPAQPQLMEDGFSGAEADAKQAGPVLARLLLPAQGIAMPASIVLAREDNAAQRVRIRLLPGPGGIHIDREDAR